MRYLLPSYAASRCTSNVITDPLDEVDVGFRDEIQHLNKSGLWQ